MINRIHPEGTKHDLPPTAGEVSPPVPEARDLRDTPLYQEAQALYESLRRPGSGLISDAAEISVHARHAVFAGTLVESLDRAMPTRICRTELDTGNTQVLTFGPNVDRLPKFSPDGSCVAFLSDRLKAGDFQLFLLDPVSGAARSTPAVKGWVEYFHWSPDGKRVLLGVAGHGADVSGGQGAITSKKAAQEMPSWMPSVASGGEAHHWRSVWIYELETNHVSRVNRDGCNVWEAAWWGNDALATVISAGHGEGLWYTATLCMMSVQDGATRTVHTPRDQMGLPTASPSGDRMAFVEAICSDRWIVAGALKLLDRHSGTVADIDTLGVDVTSLEWRSDRHLLLAGHRDFDTVVALYDAEARTTKILWESHELTTGGFHASVAGFAEPGDCVLVGRGFWRAPEVAAIRNGNYAPIRSFDVGYAAQAQVIRSVERVRWTAPDGLEVQGWLLCPHGKAPHPLVMIVHGGPVWHWRPMWLGGPFLMLLKHGYALFLPNPRGSSGRGREFIAPVVGDMGGADTHDYLSGLDHLVKQGLADPKRLGVTGGSYGGFMSAWLITQDDRFAAAVPVAPVTNHVTQHLISNIPHFVSLFLADTYSNAGGKYFQRSPVMYAHKVKTPTLTICGALDRCTPAEEASQFHSALLENDVTSVLVTYPEEGHGVRSFPAAIDYSARLVGWFEQHMPSRR